MTPLDIDVLVVSPVFLAGLVIIPVVLAPRAARQAAAARDDQPATAHDTAIEPR